VGDRGHTRLGAIRDGNAGFLALPCLPKTWENEDPTVEMLMMPSAPLVIPTCTDASLGVKVLA
jgi:hypothetical protein